MGKAKTKRNKTHSAGRRSSGSTPPSPPLDALFREVLRSAKELLDIEDPLVAELWASGLLATWHAVELIDDDPDRLFGRGLVRQAARSKRPEGLALLLALAAVAPLDVAKAARTALVPLRARGVLETSWADAVGRAEFVEAHVVEHPLGGQDALLAAFRHPSWPVHAFSILIDHDVLNGAVKDAFVVESLDKAMAGWGAQPDFTIRAVGPAELATRVMDAIEMADLYEDPPFSDDYREARSLLLARMSGLPQGWEAPEPQPIGELEREALIETFVASAEVKALAQPGRDAAADVAETIVDFRCDYGDGVPLRWNGVLAEMFLCDWYPRKVVRDESVTRWVPDVLRAWIRFAFRRGKVARHLLEDPLEAVDRFETEFREAVSDPGRFGPAKSIVLAMMRDGLELTDQNEVDRWIERFNANPLEERRRVLP